MGKKSVVLGALGGLILILFMVWVVSDSLAMKRELEDLKVVIAEPSTVVERIVVVESSSVAEIEEETVVVPIIMTMGSRSVTGGVVVEWEWQSVPKANEIFGISAEALDVNGKVIAYSCNTRSGNEFFIPCDPKVVKEVRVVARQASGQWEACGGLLFLGEKR